MKSIIKSLIFILVIRMLYTAGIVMMDYEHFKNIGRTLSLIADLIIAFPIHDYFSNKEKVKKWKKH